MLKFAKAIYEPISKGNQYRLEQYGKPQTIQESFIAAKKIRLEQKQNTHKGKMWHTDAELQCTDLYKAQFGYWDEWSGSRYDRRPNPFILFTKYQWCKKFGNIDRPDIELNSVVRSCSYTGMWSEYIETSYT
jgi:hypothetical protein|tara:strand:- start:305 stop:700 length:396 start_codon:yes stop_codon:yes gene_type:complete